MAGDDDGQLPDEAMQWNVVKLYDESDAAFYEQLVQQHGPLQDLEMWGKAFVKTPEASRVHNVNITDSEALTIELTGTRIFFEHRYDSRSAMPMTNETDAGRLTPKANALPIGMITRTVHNAAGSNGHEVWVHAKFDAQNLDASEERRLRDMLRSNRIADLSVCYVEERDSGGMYKSGGVKKSIPEVSLCQRGRLRGTHIVAVQASDSKDDDMSDTTTLSGTAEQGAVNVDSLQPESAPVPMNVDAQGGGAPAGGAVVAEPKPAADPKPAAEGSAPASEQKPADTDASSAPVDAMKAVMDRLESIEKSSRSSTSELTSAFMEMIKATQLSGGGDDKQPVKTAEKPAPVADAKPAAPATPAPEKSPEKDADSAFKLRFSALEKRLSDMAQKATDDDKARLGARATSLQPRASKCNIPIPADANSSTMDLVETAIKQVEAVNKALEAEKKRGSTEASAANKANMSTAISNKRAAPDAAGDRSKQGDAKKPRAEIGSSVDQRFQASTITPTGKTSQSKEFLLKGLQESAGAFPNSILQDNTLMTMLFAE